MFETLRGVVDSTWHMPPGPSVTLLVLHFEPGRARVDEVQLVLEVVVVGEALLARRADDPLTPNAVTPSGRRTLRKP